MGREMYEGLRRGLSGAKCLLCKQEGPSSDPQPPHQKLGVAAPASNSVSLLEGSLL